MLKIQYDYDVTYDSYPAVRRIISDLRRYRVEAGVIAGAGRRVKKRDGQYLPIVMYAAWNEFGIAHIPARPFLRNTFFDKVIRTREWPDYFAFLLMEQFLLGERRGYPIIKRMAQKMSGDIMKKVKNAKRWAVPNAPLTVANKGHDRPLMDELDMWGTLDWRIRRAD